MLTISNICKKYGDVTVLDGISAEISAGTFAAIRGVSGSGKSTLLMICAGLMDADGGQVIINGTDIASLGAKECNTFRSSTLGFVFQRFHLVPYLSVADNIRLVSLNNKSDEDETSVMVGRLESARTKHVTTQHMGGQS